MRKKVLLIVAAVCLLVLGGASGAWSQQEEPELVIVKYGKVMVQSAVPGAKVYIDDLYKEPAGTVIEKIVVGEHTISCRTGAQTVTGSFTIKKNEILKLEARFQEGKLVPVAELAKVEKAEPETPLKKEEAPKIEKPQGEKPKKPATPVKKEEAKDPESERRSLHLNVIKVYFIEGADSHRVRVIHKINPKVVGKFTEKKHSTGTYYHTKQNLLLCETGPCEQQWSSTFIYTDETGKSDSFAFTWKQIVYTGISPTGISERTLLYCLNGDCKPLEDKSDTEFSIERETGRYTMTWSKTSLTLRRSDIIKQIRAAGGDIEVY